MRTLDFTVNGEFDGRKLVAFLRGACSFSSSLTATLRHTPGGILLNGMPSRTIDRVHTGDIVTIRLPDGTPAPLLCDLPLDIIYEDDDLLVLNKPAGISMHPTHNHPNGTLANAVAAHCVRGGAPPSCVRAVGRLDKGTSGVALFAKNRFAASVLNEGGLTHKAYLAIAGLGIPKSGTIDAPIGRPFKEKTLRAVMPEGEPSVTDYSLQKVVGNYGIYRVTPRTGRTHQIRVHFSHIGVPLLGDEMYGGDENNCFSRPALHCLQVDTVHPVTKEALCFVAPLPDDFSDFEKSCL